MQQQTIVGLYPTSALAQDVRSKLQAAGIPESNIKLIASDTAGSEPAREPHHDGGILDWLFGSDVSAEEQERYSGRLRSGNVAVSVCSRSEAEHEKVVGLMEQLNPIDIEGDEASVEPRTGIAGDLTGSAQPLTGSAAAAAHRSSVGTAQPTALDGDQVIPIVQEELEVGKRQVERRHRVRTHVIETPVEENVTLRDETVSIERRPAAQANVGAEAFREREFDVIERDEEAVVSKRARVTEEVVVRKDVAEHVETIRDTVRETRVEIDGEGASGVDRAAAGSKPLSPAGGTADVALRARDGSFGKPTDTKK